MNNNARFGRKHMKECAFCGAENSDNAIYCIDCGKRLDGNVVCPACGELTNGKGTYCEMCGNRLDGKAVCECGELVEGKFCPKCGKEVKRVIYNPRSGKRTPVADASECKPWQKLLNGIGLSVAMFGVVMALIFVFFTSFKLTSQPNIDLSEAGFTDIPTSYNIFYYFGEGYTDVSEVLSQLDEYSGQFATSMYFDLILSTVIAASMLVAVTVGAIAAVIGFVRYMSGKSEKSPFGAIAFTIVSYFVGCVALFGLEYMTFNGKVTAVNVKASVAFGTATKVGLWFAGVCLIIGFLSKSVAEIFSKRITTERILNYSTVLIGTVFCVLAVYFVGTTALSEKIKVDAYSSLTYSMRLTAFSSLRFSAVSPTVTAADNPELFTFFAYSIVVALTQLASVVLAGCALTKFISHNEKRSVTNIVITACNFVFALITMIIMLLAVGLEKQLYSGTGTEHILKVYTVNVIVGFVFATLAVITAGVQFRFSDK